MLKAANPSSPSSAFLATIRKCVSICSSGFQIALMTITGFAKRKMDYGFPYKETIAHHSMRLR